MNTSTTKPRCKPGDLAFIIRSRENVGLGRIVKVLALETEDDAYKGQWRVEIQGRPQWLPWERRSVCFGWITDKSLLPIRGEEKTKRAPRRALVKA